MDTPDQQILYAIRQEISEHQLSMNATGLNLGTGVALIDASRAQWQQDPDQVVTLTAVQLAQALASAKHQGMEDAYAVAQNVVSPSASDAQPSDAQPSDAEPSDAEPSDAQPSDAQPSDAQPSDAEPSDAR